MPRCLVVVLVGLTCAGSVRAQGLLIPTQRDVPPLTMAGHEVRVTIEDQVALTHVVQTFRNHTSQALEATYVFPVPKGASVKKFTMWVDGKEVPGELVEADKARAIYTDIVRRTQDPALLEYFGNDLLRVRVFPVPARGEQKLAVSYTSLAANDGGLIEYIYPLKTHGKSAQGVERFSLEATLKAQQPIQNVYSPTHALTVQRPSDREAVVRFEGRQDALDQDFQLYYTAANKDVGLTALTHRPQRGGDGHFMLLISPRAELFQTQEAPRDVVLVLDTSGSMKGQRIAQARNALKYCLRNLNAQDRFGLIVFATTVTKYKDGLLPATRGQIDQAQRWVDGLEALGSTNIDEALSAALAMRSGDAGRTATIVFFTDGQPTSGETKAERIVQNVAAKNSASTRLFTFGVGDDVNAVLLDQLAEKTRSLSTYVRETEDIEAKVSNLYGKISHPVLTNLKLNVGKGVTISEVYPPQLPDLFQGSQLVVLGRYQGKARASIELTGMVGADTKSFPYEVHFPGRTKNDKAFVEDLWARRKVGYLLDQIRVNGESKELKDEVLTLAKQYGIATPYTSYLVAPDVAPKLTSRIPLGQDQAPYTQVPGSGRIQFAPVFVSPTMQWGRYRSGSAGAPPDAMAPGLSQYQNGSGKQIDWVEYYRDHGYQINGAGVPPIPPGCVSAPNPTPSNLAAQSGKDAVDLAQQLQQLRNQDRLAHASVREAAGRRCLDLAGVWTDVGFDPKLPVVKVKAQSDAYFRILERHPHMREVFQLGNRLVWVTPNRSVLVIDAAGEECLSDSAIDGLFVAKN